MAEVLPYKLGLGIHFEPAEPIELPALLKGLSGLGKEYEDYSQEVLGTKGGSEARLYVGSFTPGSIDILLQPEIWDAAKASLAIAAASGPVDAYTAIADFGQRIAMLLKRFEGKPDPAKATIQDCNNAINIVSPTVQAGGSQTINVVNINGDFTPVIEISGARAHKIAENAYHVREQLKLPTAERFTAQAMVWKTVDRSPGQTEKLTSLDKGLIPEIDPKPKSIIFGDDNTLKDEVLSDGENPLQMVYYVDVEVVRVDDRIKAYRIVGFHGKEPIGDDE